jgi:hypothetical protein
MSGWQGLVLAIGSLIFAPGLIAMVWADHKAKKRLTPLLTSVPTAAVLWSYVLVYMTMDSSFLYAAVTTGATAMMWTILAVKWQTGGSK